MKRETNLMLGFGMAVMAGIVVALFTTKDMFEAPAWAAIRSALSSDLGMGLAVGAAGALSIFCWYWFDVWNARQKTEAAQGVAAIEEQKTPSPVSRWNAGLAASPAPLVGTLSGLLTLTIEARAELGHRTPIFSDRFRAEARLTLSELHAHGIPTPPLNGQAKKDLERLASFIDTMMPSLRARNFTLARREAENWLQRNRLVGLS